MHFGENQLSPRSISISPLSTGHPPVLQHWWVRASTDCHIRFTLPMDSSRGFGSHPRHGSGALLGLGCPLAPLLGGRLTGRRGCTRRIILQKARHQPLLAPATVASGCWGGRGFRVSFIPLAGCFSPFPHGTGSLSVAEGIEPWRVVPPASHKLTGVRGTQDPSRIPSWALYRALTVSGSAFQRFGVQEVDRVAGPTTPLSPKAQRFGLFPFRSPLLRESHVDFFSSGY